MVLKMRTLVRSNGVCVVLGINLPMCYCNTQEVDRLHLAALCPYVAARG